MLHRSPSVPVPRLRGPPSFGARFSFPLQHLSLTQNPTCRGDSRTGSSVSSQGLWAVAVLPFPSLPEDGSGANRRIPEKRVGSLRGWQGSGLPTAGREFVAWPLPPQLGPSIFPGPVIP